MQNMLQKEIKKLDDLYKRGLLKDAEKIAVLITEEYPNNQFGWKILGAILAQTGRLSESEIANRKAVELSPKDAYALNNLGFVLQSLDRLIESEITLKKAIQFNKDLSAAHFNLGNTFHKLSKTDEAIDSYRMAISIKPDYFEAYIHLCQLLERTNNLDSALNVINDALMNIKNGKSHFLYFKALLFFRKEMYELSSATLEKVKVLELSNDRKVSFLKLKADLYDITKNYSLAFETYKQMNQAIKLDSSYSKNIADKFFNNQVDKVNQIKLLEINKKYEKNKINHPIDPIFLIGFPRSGTTLLDTILRTHSKINVIEEQPMVIKMENAFSNTIKISEIECIDNSMANNLSKFYFKELKNHINIDDKKVIIDKFPLNIIKLPLISNIFQNSKFILALRHPFDCILSCWMQNFRLNAPMSNLLDIERIVEFYCIEMEFISLCQKRYSLDIHKIKYENLISNFRSEITNTLSFLNLKWENDLINYQNTALSRVKINTPSYSQVIKPLYSNSSYRWKNYEKYLSSFKKQLEPWIEEFNYTF